MSTDTQRTNFLGIPIEGDIKRGSNRSKQRPVEELTPLLRAVLDDDVIASFGWRQYTPYFNDGEPCEFGVRTPWFRTATEDEDADEWQLEISDHPTLGKRNWRTDAYEGPDEERWARCEALSDAIEGGEFEDALLEAFGDHAYVTVTRDGIKVDFYNHD
jgi:hypothetical protein